MSAGGAGHRLVALAVESRTGPAGAADVAAMVVAVAVLASATTSRVQRHRSAQDNRWVAVNAKA